MKFELGRQYRRRELHASFGGQEQGGISTPSKYPIILLFMTDSGDLYGYRDGLQADGSYKYTGEGQRHDMAFVRGNRAIRDHERDGKTLHLFRQIRPAFVEYLGEMRYAGHEFVDNVPDVDGSARRAIVFRLEPK